jgi:hypothetical protein
MDFMNRPKKINLSAYGASSNTIGITILALFQSGGGSKTVTGVGSFWDDVTTNKPLNLELHMDTNVKFIILGPTMYKMGRVVQVAFSVMLYQAGAGVFNIQVSIADNGAGDAIVTVKVSQ